MARTVATGALVALLAAIVAVSGTAIGITTVWPVLLAVAVGLAAAPVTPGRAGAFALGAIVSWIALALRAGVLPAIPATPAIVAAGAVVVLAVLAAVTHQRLPLWAGLAGYAAFAGLYEPLFAARPTAFLTESPVVLVTVLLSAALGLAVAALSQLLTADGAVATPEHVEVSEGGAA